jgi:hypothetical protein
MTGHLFSGFSTNSGKPTGIDISFLLAARAN